MDAKPRITLVAALVACAGLLAAGCGDQAAEKVGRSVDRTASQTASAAGAAAGEAANLVADATITGKVKAAIFAEPGLKSLQIDVDTHDAVVTLSGNVGTPDERDRALRLAQSIDGVVSVVDRLAVKPTG